MWDRWPRGVAMSLIGRHFNGASSSIFPHLAQFGGIRRLVRKRSPQRIAGWLKRKNPNEKQRRMSHAIPGFLMLAKVETKDTQSVITAPIEQAKKRLKELSWAQSSEMAGHRGFTMAAKIEAYFCHPNRPRQRGGNENTNRHLRP